MGIVCGMKRNWNRFNLWSLKSKKISKKVLKSSITWKTRTKLFPMISGNSETKRNISRIESSSWGKSSASRTVLMSCISISIFWSTPTKESRFSRESWVFSIFYLFSPLEKIARRVWWKREIWCSFINFHYLFLLSCFYCRIKDNQFDYYFIWEFS